MAKLTGPFFSLKASGQLGKTLVAFPWKGINALRTYVIPANPRSDAQVIQRGYFEDAVDEWHGAAYNAADAVAWNRFAGILAKIMSGFNAMVKTYIDEAILGNTWNRLTGVSVAYVEATTMTAYVDCPDKIHLPVIHWGTSKTHFPNSADMELQSGDQYRYNFTGLTKDTLYYFYIHHGFSGIEYGRTGIYSQRTAPA